MLFTTSFTATTCFAMSPARFFWSLELTKPLNWTVPLKVSTLTPSYLYWVSSPSLALTRADVPWSSMRSPVLCSYRLPLTQPLTPRSNGRELRVRINLKAFKASLVFTDVFFIVFIFNFKLFVRLFTDTDSSFKIPSARHPKSSRCQALDG